MTTPNVFGSQVTEYFDALASNREFSGVVYVLKRGEVAYERAWGEADFARGEPLSTSDRFAIASLTKTFTAAAILTLKDAGLLSLDDPVARHVPAFAHGETITIRNLLRFESGLAEVELSDRVYTSASLLQALGAQPLLYEPGTDGQYGNAGFDLLALVVEAVSGRSFEAYLDDTFFTPLGMLGTGGRRTLTGSDPALVSPHAPGPPSDFLFRIVWSENPSLFPGSGGLYSTAGDLGRWGRAISDGRVVDLSREDYPWGWGRTEVEGHSGIEQTGLTRGYTSSIQIFPDDDLVIVILSNVENGLWTTWAKDTARIVFGAVPVLATEPYDYIPPPERSARSLLVGRYRLNDERVVDIRDRDGHLWLHLNDYPVGRYMLPLRDGSFQLRDFTGTITFEPYGTVPAEALHWRLPEVWGGDVQTYYRVGEPR